MPSTCFKSKGSSSGRQLYILSWYGTFYMHHYKQSGRKKSVFDTNSSTYKTAYTDACKMLYHTCIYNHLPQDEPLGSK